MWRVWDDRVVRCQIVRVSCAEVVLVSLEEWEMVV